MVNEPQDLARAAERGLALGYAPAERRAALTTLFALDDRLRAITLAARDPTIGLMRLTWWREALERLDVARPPAEPLLVSLAAELLPRGVRGAALATMTDAWERVLYEAPNWAAVADARARLFTLAGDLLGIGDSRLPALGAAWAAVDLAAGWREAARVDHAAFAPLYRKAWPPALRALGALGLLARFDAAGRTRAGDPRRVARLLAHRLTGR